MGYDAADERDRTVAMRKDRGNSLHEAAGLGPANRFHTIIAWSPRGSL
jgi:hypothetical protein